MAARGARRDPLRPQWAMSFGCEGAGWNFEGRPSPLPDVGTEGRASPDEGKAQLDGGVPGGEPPVSFCPASTAPVCPVPLDPALRCKGSLSVPCPTGEMVTPLPKLSEMRARRVNRVPGQGVGSRRSCCPRWTMLPSPSGRKEGNCQGSLRARGGLGCVCH